MAHESLDVRDDYLQARCTIVGHNEGKGPDYVLDLHAFAWAEPGTVGATKNPGTLVSSLIISDQQAAQIVSAILEARGWRVMQAGWMRGTSLPSDGEEAVGGRDGTREY